MAPSTVTASNTKRHNYIEGLDGIRALAVFAVIFFHAQLFNFLPGGFLGVDVFFVLSGFLISHIILQDFARPGHFSLWQFYLRRAKRLLPALYVLIGVAALYAMLLARDAIEQLQKDIPAAFLYLSNFWQLWDKQSYFEQFSRPHVLKHLWSLAVEEQFYIIWPILLLFFYRLRRWIPLVVSIATLALLSMGWMWFLAEWRQIPISAAPERLYLGTDTHAHSLLFGALLAAVYRPRAARQAWEAVLATLLGLASLAFLLYAFYALTEAQEFLYRGGFAMVAVATVLLIWSASLPKNPINTLFQNPVLDWLGKRSYALYLWHWPVFVFLRPGQELMSNPWQAFALRLALTVALSALSYRFLEEPIRRHGWQAFGRWSRWIYGVLVLALAAVLLALYLQKPPADELPDWAEPLEATLDKPLLSPAYALEEVPMLVIVDEDADGAISDATSSSMFWLEEGGAALSAETLAAQAGYETSQSELDSATSEKESADTDLLAELASEVAAAEPSDRITALGDSVMLGARPALTRVLPISYLDAQVGRQAHELLKLLKQMKQAQTLTPTVLMHIGTNGYIYERNLREMLTLLDDRERVVLINVHADRRWTPDNNQVLAEVTQKFSNVLLIDWAQQGRLHPEYFASDGIHLSGSGMRAYSELVRSALNIPENFVRPKLTVVPSQQELALQKQRAAAAQEEARRSTVAPKPTATATAVPKKTAQKALNPGAGKRAAPAAVTPAPSRQAMQQASEPAQTEAAAVPEGQQAATPAARTAESHEPPQSVEPVSAPSTPRQTPTPMMRHQLAPMPQQPLNHW